MEYTLFWFELRYNNVRVMDCQVNWVIQVIIPLFHDKLEYHLLLMDKLIWERLELSNSKMFAYVE
jgi:hypothetical protein